MRVRPGAKKGSYYGWWLESGVVSTMVIVPESQYQFKFIGMVTYDNGVIKEEELYLDCFELVKP